MTLVPGIPEWVVAVAHVRGLVAAYDGVGPGARTGDDEVVVRQVERLDCGRVERQERPKGAGVGPQSLKEGCVNLAVREESLRAPLVVDRCEHVRVRPQVAHLEEDTVRAA